MAESENVYVKIGERGLLIERVANTPRDHVNFRGLGWVLKGSKGAPTRKDATADPADPADVVPPPTSVKAYADAAAAGQDVTGATDTATTGGAKSASTRAAERAAAKSQAAAGA